VLFSLAIGGPRPWCPWALLHRLPVLSSERVPIRLLIAFTLAVGVIAGLGANFLAQRRKPVGAIVGSALLLAAVFDAWLVSKPNLRAPVAGEPPSVSASTQFRQIFGSTWDMLPTAMSNTGALHCNEELDFHDVLRMDVIGFNEPGYFGEQYLVRPGSVTPRRWTPNALSYDVDTPSSNVLVVNQNYDANWRLVEGEGEVFSEGGLIGVRIRAGRQHLKLIYRSYLFLAGAAVTLVTFIVGLALWRRAHLAGLTKRVDREVTAVCV
jgi:hypothetical protein